MPTDYACQAAVEQAARAVAPVREHLLPPNAPPPPPADLPAPLRDYLGPGYPGAPAAERGPRRPSATSRQAHGAAALRLFLDGLRAELSDGLVDWVARLEQELAVALEVAEGTAAPPSAGGGSAWQALSAVRQQAQEVLTLLVARYQEGESRQRELHWRLVVVTDLCAGALRRMTVPGESAVACASELADAAGSLFGLRVARRPAT